MEINKLAGLRNRVYLRNPVFWNLACCDACSPVYAIIYSFEVPNFKLYE
jgi:hypothetical protein